MRTPQSPTKQTGGHPGHPGYPGYPYLGWWTVLLTVAVSTTAVVGCGDVHFLPSPFTPQNVELVYSAQEHLTIVRWRVEATAPVDETRFELLGPDGYQPIDFSRSLFTGGVVACGDGTHSCAQYVVRGHYPQRPTAGQFRPVRAVHEFYGELPGAPAKSRTIEETFTMKAFFNFKNDPVFVNLTDHVASDGDYKFPRAFERALWPTAGVCVSDTLPDDVVFHPLDLMTGIPPEKPLTAAGRYCVAIRPVPADDGDRAMLQVPIATLPEVVTAKQVLNPPVETSPIIYQVILDLEIPIPDRCAEAGTTIENLTAKYMRGGTAAVRKLPTITLSPGCHQPNDRTIAAAQIADVVKQTVASFTEVHHQYHLLYFNNVDGFLQPQLTQTFEELFAALAGPPPGHTLQTFAWLFSPPTTRALSDLPWMYPDPVADLRRSRLRAHAVQLRDEHPPVQDAASQLRDSGSAAVARGRRDLRRQADQDLHVEPPGSPGVVDRAIPDPIFEPNWEITTADPPSYLVGLPVQVEEPASSFVAAQARVSYQICTRYCEGHGYVAENGVGPLSWVDSELCASKDY